MTTTTLVDRLVELGMNDLEARTYLALVRHGPGTAYSVARILGKATANVYKATDSLEAKGAIYTEPGESRVLHPVPPEEFLAQYSRRQAETIDRVVAAFKKLSVAPPSTGLFQLESPDAVLERARRMLKNCKAIAVVDCFPHALEALRSDIEAVHQRGVKTFVLLYVPAKIQCGSLACVPGGEQTVAYWQSQQINIACDGQEVLLALCTDDLTKVIEAYWSNSVYLACLQLAGFLKEHAFHQIRGLLEDGEATTRKLRKIFDGCPLFQDNSIPGQLMLAKRIADAETT